MSKFWIHSTSSKVIPRSAASSFARFLRRTHPAFSCIATPHYVEYADIADIDGCDYLKIVEKKGWSTLVRRSRCPLVVAVSLPSGPRRRVRVGNGAHSEDCADKVPAGLVLPVGVLLPHEPLVGILEAPSGVPFRLNAALGEDDERAAYGQMPFGGNSPDLRSQRGGDRHALTNGSSPGNGLALCRHASIILLPCTTVVQLPYLAGATSIEGGPGVATRPGYRRPFNSTPTHVGRTSQW